MSYLLKKGDKVAILSLSRGILGEEFCKHQLELGINRLKELNLVPVFMENTLKGMDFLEKNPKARAEDLVEAFKDNSIKAILCAIGGIDGIKIAPYIFENKEYMKIIKENPKIFIGYSDTTSHHLILNKLGIDTFYGISFLTDIAELDENMLDYTKESFFKLFSENDMKYTPSIYWQEERTDFSPNALNTKRKYHKEEKGYILLKGNSKFNGKLIGGCLESLNELIGKERFEYSKEIEEKYHLFPNVEEFKNTILFLETSELKIKPYEFKEMLISFEKTGIFEVINGIIFGKPQDEKYFEEYIEIIKEVIQKYDISVAYNFNFGHAYPKMIIQYGKMAYVDIDKQEIIIKR